jgi:putative transport protein
VLLPLLAVQMVLKRRRAKLEPIVSRSVVVERPVAALGELRQRHPAAVAFGRIRHGGSLAVATDEVAPEPGDVLSVVGRPVDVEEVVAELGHEARDRIELDRRELDFRRIVVSSRRVAGRRLADLDLDERYEATVTRVRRGDVDLVADPEMLLELGDRVRVVCPRKRMAEVTRFFSDSYRALGEIDVLSFSLGIAAGLALGAIAFPLPGGGTFELGAVRPLVGVRLPRGARGNERGRVAAAPGRHAGLLRLAPETLSGLIAGAQTQPAVLAFAAEQLDDDRELNLGYASVYPVAIIAKLVLAQLILG